IAAGVSYAADQTIYAGPPNQYVNPSITIDQGGKVTFSNLDTASHDVTADAKGPDGKQLFASATIGAGQSAPVVGTEYLTTGDYTFHCSVHASFMKGTIHVTGNG